MVFKCNIKEEDTGHGGCQAPYPGISSFPLQHKPSSNQAIPQSQANLSAEKYTADHEARRFQAAWYMGHALGKHRQGSIPEHSSTVAQEAERILLAGVCHS